MTTRLRLALLSFAILGGALLHGQGKLIPIQKQPLTKLPVLRIIKTKEELIAFVETLNVDLAKMNAHEKAIYGGFVELGAAADKLGAAAEAVGQAAGAQGQQQLLDATKQLQETQMSFNLQYLQLQSQMQHENRSYTAVSNIMKTKHDTVKNSISNVR